MKKSRLFWLFPKLVGRGSDRRTPRFHAEDFGAEQIIAAASEYNAFDTVTVKGSIRKVDRDDPSKGLAGATIAIQGVDNSFYGEYQPGAGGALEGLAWSSLTPGTYRAWEVSAPEGYSLAPSDVKTFRISAETPEVQLVFKDDANVKVRLTKLDASDNPLPGAVFNIFRDGQIIATEATDANGEITEKKHLE